MSKPDHAGLVVAGHGRHYIVETDDGRRLVCHPRGKRSDCVVGDRVRWTATSGDGNEGVIDRIETRRNLLFRQDEWKTKSFASNLDALIVLVASDPAFSESQLARALIAAESCALPSRIVLNKADLPQIGAARERLKPYQTMGYEVIEVALKAHPDAARERLEDALMERTTLVLGPSGSGKSTLINLMVPSADAQVGEISTALQAGRHTTTVTRLYWVDPERRTAVIDSPGFQEFGLRQVDPANLASLMPDFREPLTACRFYNCTHLHEPGCGVSAAVGDGRITATRYRIYGEIFQELSTRRWG